MLIQNEKTIDKNIKYWGLKMESALGEIGRRFIIQIQTYIDHLVGLKMEINHFPL